MRNLSELFDFNSEFFADKVKTKALLEEIESFVRQQCPKETEGHNEGLVAYLLLVCAIERCAWARVAKTKLEGTVPFHPEEIVGVMTYLLPVFEVTWRAQIERLEKIH